jgi:IS5 family transposase
VFYAVWRGCSNGRSAELVGIAQPIDRRFGLIRKWQATDTAAYEGARPRQGLLDKSNTASTVWADTAYRSKANETFMEANGFVSRIHRKKPKGKPMPEAVRKRPATAAL